MTANGITDSFRFLVYLDARNISIGFCRGREQKVRSQGTGDQHGRAPTTILDRIRSTRSRLCEYLLNKLALRRGVGLPVGLEAFGEFAL